MLSYESLDAIADSINPVLGVVALLVPWVWHRKAYRYSLMLNALVLSAVGLAYVLQGLDSWLAIWPRTGLDFSTHAAVFVAIGTSLWHHGMRWRAPIAALGIAYASLMVYQRYHSWLDIVSTVVVMLCVLVPLWWSTARLHRSKSLA